jgi:hypothetical protein
VRDGLADQTKGLAGCAIMLGGKWWRVN